MTEHLTDEDRETLRTAQVPVGPRIEAAVGRIITRHMGDRDARLAAVEALHSGPSHPCAGGPGFGDGYPCPTLAALGSAPTVEAPA